MRSLSKHVYLLLFCLTFFGGCLGCITDGLTGGSDSDGDSDSSKAAVEITVDDDSKNNIDSFVGAAFPNAAIPSAIPSFKGNNNTEVSKSQISYPLIMLGFVNIEDILSSLISGDDDCIFSAFFITTDSTTSSGTLCPGKTYQFFAGVLNEDGSFEIVLNGGTYILSEGDVNITCAVGADGRMNVTFAEGSAAETFEGTGESFDTAAGSGTYEGTLTDQSTAEPEEVIAELVWSDADPPLPALAFLENGAVADIKAPDFYTTLSGTSLQFSYTRDGNTRFANCTSYITDTVTLSFDSAAGTLLVNISSVNINDGSNCPDNIITVKEGTLTRTSDPLYTYAQVVFDESTTITLDTSISIVTELIYNEDGSDDPLVQDTMIETMQSQFGITLTGSPQQISTVDFDLTDNVGTFSLGNQIVEEIAAEVDGGIAFVSKEFLFGEDDANFAVLYAEFIPSSRGDYVVAGNLVIKNSESTLKHSGKFQDTLVSYVIPFSSDNTLYDEAGGDAEEATEEVATVDGCYEFTSQAFYAYGYDYNNNYEEIDCTLPDEPFSLFNEKATYTLYYCPDTQQVIVYNDCNESDTFSWDYSSLSCSTSDTYANCYNDDYSISLYYSNYYGTYFGLSYYSYVDNLYCSAYTSTYYDYSMYGYSSYDSDYDRGCSDSGSGGQSGSSGGGSTGEGGSSGESGGSNGTYTGDAVVTYYYYDYNYASSLSTDDLNTISLADLGFNLNEVDSAALTEDNGSYSLNFLDAAGNTLYTKTMDDTYSYDYTDGLYIDYDSTYLSSYFYNDQCYVGYYSTDYSSSYYGYGIVDSSILESAALSNSYGSLYLSGDFDYSVSMYLSGYYNNIYFSISIYSCVN